jgi:hypothetical protein
MASRLKRRIPVIFGGVGGATGSSTMAAIGRMLRWGIGAAAGSASTAYVGSSVVSSGGFTAETGFSASPSTSYVNGATVTITDTQSRFGTKPYGAKPFYWIPNAVSGVNDPAYSRGSAIAPGSLQGSIVTAIKPTGEAGSWRFDMSSNNGTAWNSGFTLPSDGCSIYMWSKRRYGVSFGSGGADYTYNFKMNRWWQATIGGGTSISVIEQGNGSEGGGGANLRLSCNGTTVYGSSPPHRANTWDVYEQIFIPSSAPDVQDGVWNTMRNGIGRLNPNTYQWITRDSASPGHIYRVFTDDHVNPSQDGALVVAQRPIYVYYGPMLVEDSLCRIIVSPESSYQDISMKPTPAVSPTEYTREVQLPTAWAAGSITFTLRQGELASFSGNYLYVVKSDGTALKIGRFT